MMFGNNLCILQIFQFTPLREGRPMQMQQANCCCEFQFTPLREGRRLTYRGRYVSTKFQFTPLREGRRCCTSIAGTVHDFNSRPCGRGDTKLYKFAISATPISIHAPAGGATRYFRARGNAKLFQFTPLREGRPTVEEAKKFYPELISIHAPAGGAT